MLKRRKNHESKKFMRIRIKKEVRMRILCTEKIHITRKCYAQS